MSEYRYDISVYESCVGPSPLMVERQDPDDLTYFPTRKRCAWDLAAYVFKYELHRKYRTYLFKVFTASAEVHISKACIAAQKIMP